jgi:hypothetical protein
VDTAARTICGRATSLSPFALGFVPLNRGPLVLKRLKVVATPTVGARAGAGNDQWSLGATLETATAASTFLADVAGGGVTFELFDPVGRVDRVAFGATDCGFTRHRGSVVCKLKNHTHNVGASFEGPRTGKAGRPPVFLVSANFKKRQLGLATQPAKGAPPLLELRIATPTALGTVAVNATKCRASAKKVYCKG